MAHPVQIRISDAIDLGAAGVEGVPVLEDEDPLCHDDLLLEAQVLDMKVNFTEGVMTVLFDLRQAFHFRDSNVAILSCRRCTSLDVLYTPSGSPLHAHSVFGSRWRGGSGGVLFEMDLYPGPESFIKMGGASLSFMAGSIKDISPAPPDYGTSSVVEARRSMPSWDSDFIPLWRSWRKVSTAL